VYPAVLLVCFIILSKENEICVEKEWKNLQNILKSAGNESLGIMKRRNRRNYLKMLFHKRYISINYILVLK